jgi:hypothetical protein
MLKITEKIANGSGTTTSKRANVNCVIDFHALGSASQGAVAEEETGGERFRPIHRAPKSSRLRIGKAHYRRWL